LEGATRIPKGNDGSTRIFERGGRIHPRAFGMNVKRKGLREKYFISG
jgi:hypothetical protein